MDYKEEAKIDASELCRNRTIEETFEILRKEGNSSIESDRQHNSWWDVFELSHLCDRAGLSELEKWYVLSGRFELAKRT